MIPTEYYIFLGSGLFTIGVIGVLTRRNVLIILMSIELILNAVNINLVALSQYFRSVDGQVFAIFVITDAAAEAAVGLGLIIALFRNKETVNADEIDLVEMVESVRVKMSELAANVFRLQLQLHPFENHA